MSEKYVVYSAKPVKAGSITSLKNLWANLNQYQWHISQMFHQDFVSAYRLTRFGAIWNYILPLVPLTVWVLLNTLRFFPSFDGVSSVVYVTIGVTLWFLFAGLVSTPITTIESRIKDSAKSRIPIVGIVVANLARLSFDTLVRIAGTALIFGLFQGAPHWMIIFVPFVAFFAFFFFSGLGLMLAIFNLAFRDINKIVPILLQYGIMLSSVIFPLDSIKVLAQVSLFNPFYVFIDTIRTLIVFGEINHPVPLAGFSVIGIIMFVFACRLIEETEPRLRGWA